MLGTNFEQAPFKSGVSAAVFDGTKLWSGSLGVAKPNRDMTTNTPMIIRSTSKTFLGALIMMQIEDGLYQLQDTIATLLSDHPDYASIDIPNVNTDVTVEQLLTMTSGMDDWSEQSDFQSRLAIMMDRDWKPANNLSKIPTKFVDPGMYHYSYTNSILLGIIAAHKGDKHLNDIYQEVFFEPLGITGGLLPEIEMPVGTAVPYDDLSLYQAGVGFGPLNTGFMAQTYGKSTMISWAGAGIVSTPENIARWGYELFSPSGSAISSTTRQKLIAAMQIPTDPGMASLGMRKYGYYMGSGAVALRGGTEITVYTHPGGGGGRTSWLYYSPELDLSISLLANSQMLHEPGQCGHRGYDYMSVGECIAGAIFGSFVD
ncbi:MAG: serine hydrolase [Dehalococcoidia bacterium]|nr:serine hydrolase [Dehalococcoidia bacterium]